MAVMPINEFLSIREGRLFIEECDATNLASNFGTPIFVVSESHLRRNLRQYKETFSRHWPEGCVRIMPSLKANPLLAVRQILSREGCGCDVFGAGELEGAIRGGVHPADISVNGSIKDRAIIHKAVSLGARIVLDSPKEMLICEEEAARLGKKARVMFRLKPFMADLDNTSDFLPSEKISELTQLIKYGIPTSELLPMGPHALASPHLEPVGVHVHMGRHSKKLAVWEAWVRHSIILTKLLSDNMDGWVPQEIDLGGGFPSATDKDTDVYVREAGGPTLDQYAQTITETLRNTLQAVGMSPQGIQIEIEPGRGLHTDTGVHLTRVCNIKEERENRPRKWAEVDTSEVFLGITGFNEEPPFDFVIANKADKPGSIRSDIVGQTCNAEQLFSQVKVPLLEEGDIVALLNTGAYIEPMAANFNALPRPGTLLICADQADLIKRHETVEDVFARDSIPSRLQAADQTLPQDAD